MLESVQVFRSLGKNSEKKTSISSLRGQRTFSSNNDPRPGPIATVVLNMPHEGQGPNKTWGKAEKAESSDHKACPSFSQYEVHPQLEKSRLIPLPFPTLDRSQVRAVSTKLLPLASRKPIAAYPMKSTSHSAQSTTLWPAQPPSVNTSLMTSAKPALPVCWGTTWLNVTNCIQSSTVPQMDTLRPATYRASSHSSLQRELVSAARNKTASPHKSQTQYLPQDFSC